ncbi:MAG: MmgE/PrpD family protein [Pseudomonadales bacterium]|nr:MmgE/PrpD family protein [Pseudomonadales bacterium]
MTLSKPASASDPLSLCQQFGKALSADSPCSDQNLAKARLCLLDYLANVFASQELPWVQQAISLARNNSARNDDGGAGIIATSLRVSVQDAALANAVAGHALVRDDMHVNSVSHLGTVVIPTALALAEQGSGSGEQLLTAIICGYEAGARLGSLLMDVDVARKIRPTGLIGAFAAAATAAKSAALEQEPFSHALGFAANYITGLNEWAATGSSDMYFHPGIAARNGISAMQLAQLGAASAPGSLDGRAGLFAAFSKPVPANPVLPFQAEAEIHAVFFKQVPACNYAQTAAQAALQLRTRHAFDLEELSRIRIRVPHAAAHYPGCDQKGPFHSILQARMSIYFNVASALLHGNFAEDNYHKFQNEKIDRLIAKSDLDVDEILTGNYPGQQGARITVTLQNQTRLDASLEEVTAASAEEVEGRFLQAATTCLGEDQAGRLVECIASLKEQGSLADFFRLLQKR